MFSFKAGAAVKIMRLITSDYQNYLEKEWINGLKAKYPVVVNEETVKTLFK
jgi:hypothetical protein